MSGTVRDRMGDISVSYPTRRARGGRRHRNVEVVSQLLRDEIRERVLHEVVRSPDLLPRPEGQR